MYGSLCVQWIKQVHTGILSFFNDQTYGRFRLAIAKNGTKYTDLTGTCLSSVCPHVHFTNRLPTSYYIPSYGMPLLAGGRASNCGCQVKMKRMSTAARPQYS